MLYPNGVLIEDDYLHTAQAIQSTEKAVAAGVNAIFEATAKADRFTARADILNRVKKGADAWDMIEVKSSTEVKDVYLYDLAFQKYVFEQSGTKIPKDLPVPYQHPLCAKGRTGTGKALLGRGRDPSNRPVDQKSRNVKNFLRPSIRSANPKNPLAPIAKIPTPVLFTGIVEKGPMTRS